MPRDYVDAQDGFRLGEWVKNQRAARAEMSQPRRSQLESLGLVWEPLEDSWEKGFSSLARYADRHAGSVSPAQTFVDDAGFPLGAWVAAQRARRNRMSDERRSRLERLGFVWRPRQAAWDSGLASLVAYIEREGCASPPQDAVDPETGFGLGVWVNTQRNLWRDGALPRERVERLQSVGFVWDALEDQWERGIAELREYKRHHGTVYVPVSYTTADGLRLGAWVVRRKQELRDGALCQLRAKELQDLGLRHIQESRWEVGFAHLCEHTAANNGAIPLAGFIDPADGYATGSWVEAQVRTWRSGKVTPRDEEGLPNRGSRYSRYQT